MPAFLKALALVSVFWTLASGAEQLLLAPLSSARYGCASASAGSIAAFGGGTLINGSASTEVDFFDTASGNRVASVSFSYARRKHTAVGAIGHDGTAYFFFAGGELGSTASSTYDVITLIPPTASTSTVLRNVPLPRGARCCMAAAGIDYDAAHPAQSGHMLIAGGRTLSGSVVNEVLWFKTQDQSLTLLGTLSESKSDIEAVAMDNVVVFSGGRDGGGNPRKKVDVFIVSNAGVWSKYSKDMTTDRYGHASGMLRTRAGLRAYFAGGWNNDFRYQTFLYTGIARPFVLTLFEPRATESNPLQSFESLSILYSYSSPSISSSSVLSLGLSSARGGLSGKCSGVICTFIGGMTADGTLSNRIDELTVNGTTQVISSYLAQPITEIASAAPLLSGLVVFAGGVCNDSFVSDAVFTLGALRTCFGVKPMIGSQCLNGQWTVDSSTSIRTLSLVLDVGQQLFVDGVLQIDPNGRTVVSFTGVDNNVTVPITVSNGIALNGTLALQLMEIVANGTALPLVNGSGAINGSFSRIEISHPGNVCLTGSLQQSEASKVGVVVLWAEPSSCTQGASKRSMIALIIGVSIGAAAVVVIAALFALLILRKRKPFGVCFHSIPPSQTVVGWR